MTAINEKLYAEITWSCVAVHAMVLVFTAYMTTRVSPSWGWILLVLLFESPSIGYKLARRAFGEKGIDLWSQK